MSRTPLKVTSPWDANAVYEYMDVAVGCFHNTKGKQIWMRLDYDLSFDSAFAVRGHIMQFPDGGPNADEEDEMGPPHTDPADGMTVYGGTEECGHLWEEMDCEPPKDVCVHCGGTKF